MFGFFRLIMENIANNKSGTLMLTCVCLRECEEREILKIGPPLREGERERSGLVETPAPRQYV